MELNDTYWKVYSNMSFLFYYLLNTFTMFTVLTSSHLVETQIKEHFSNEVTFLKWLLKVKRLLTSI